MTPDPRRYRHNATGLVFRVVVQARSLDGTVELAAIVDDSSLLTTNDRLAVEFTRCDVDAPPCDESVNAAGCARCSDLPSADWCAAERERRLHNAGAPAATDSPTCTGCGKAIRGATGVAGAAEAGAAWICGRCLLGRRSATTSAASARVEGAGYVGSAGRDRDGVLRIAIDASGDRETWLTMLVDAATARAFGARIGDRVRVTVEVIDDAQETQ